MDSRLRFKEGPEGVKWELGFSHFQCWELGFHVFYHWAWDFLNATGNGKNVLKIGTGVSRFFC